MSNERASEALRMVESDPRRAATLAEQAYREAVANRDGAAAALAKRAWGYAAFHLDDIDVAVRHLRAAVRLGRAAGATGVAAEARMALAGVLSQCGRPAAALREIDAALAGLAGIEHARALVQKGAILQLLGRPDEALPCYRVAVPVLRRGGDLVWVQRVLLNRGVMHAQRREFDLALTDLHAAEQVCAELGLDLGTGFVHQNLGFVYSRSGDVPAALAYLDRAETRFRALRSQLWSVLSDRAELLLSVRLIAEARAAAEEAVAACERERRLLVLPEARLLLAQAALLDGDLPTAERQAAMARLDFTRHGKPDWAALAQLTVLRCRLAGGSGRRPGVPLLERIAGALAPNWPDQALEAWIAAALSLHNGRSGDRDRLLGLASVHRRHGVATLRARAWYAEALRHVPADPARALRAARAGLRILDEHVAGLGATDLRAHAAGHRTDLAELGLAVALRNRRLPQVFEWAELGRASHLTHRPVHPPVDAELAGTVAELRSTTAERGELRGDGDSRKSASLRHRQAALERQIRDHHRRHPGAEAALTRPPQLAEVSHALGDAALLEFIQHGDALLALSVIGGQVRLHPLGPLDPVVSGVSAIGFALRRLLRTTLGQSGQDAARQLLEHAAGRLDALLLGGVPALADRRLVVVPTGPLQSLPWAVLPSCRGRPVTVVPSANLWLLANRVGPAAPDGRTVVVAGPDLPGAAAEAAAVAAIYGVTPITGAGATVDTVAKALDGATLAHLATHGLVRSDNPLFSALRFADGPLMLHDIEALDRAPDTVVLAACETGRPVVLAGDELMGLGATLLAHGSRRLVAPVIDVLDIETAPLMVAFHRLLATGVPAATALASAQQAAADAHPAGLAAVAPFICLGAC
ncbi:MAG TPA: CHAT domain-containing protein [Actinophytocola sp.]|uniref:CHAT domain-containing protein n=1 Tax=Actinophytocola sp. TaxID=1872138 RepID=UPI002DFFAEA9|nr:CHAT domain-containing protein [Actinophytocola sp.]